MKVSLTSAAEDDLVAIYEYIARDSPVRAMNILDKITNRSQQIELFPMSGRNIPELSNKDIREIFEGPYRIVYHIIGEQIEVLTVIHTAREFPPHD